MNKLVFWGLAFLVVASIIYMVSDTLVPFVISFIFAYLLQPIIDKISQRFDFPRNLISSAIFAVFISSFIIILLLLLPIIYDQISIFITKIPNYKNNFSIGLSYLVSRIDTIDPDIANKLSESLQNFVNSAFSVVVAAANNIWSYTLATINFFAIIILVPVILYYFLRDWPKMIKSVESILPRKEKNKIGKIFSDINSLLSAYIRGQLNICLLLSAYYFIGLSLIGIDLALLLAIISGFLVIIPFIGAFISLFLMLVSCYFSYGASVEIVYILVLFVIAHIIESYILTPQIIGDKIGLHPVWIIFSVFAAGSVFGFVGIVFAIPIAGVIKILLFNMIDYYKSTKIYNR
jgi:putative permease